MNQRRLIQLAVTAVIAAMTIGVGVLWPKHTAIVCAPTRTSAEASLGVVHFTDAVHNTALVIQTDPNAPDVGHFTFDTAAGVAFVGGPATGFSAHAAPMNAATCAGLTQVFYSGPAQVIAPTQQGASAQVATARVQLEASLDLAHLAATISFRDLTDRLSFVDTTLPPPDAMATTQKFNQSATRQDWVTMYQDMASADTLGLTPAQFAQQMATAAQQTGTITAITVTSGPTVKSTAEGVVYYIVEEQVTVSLNGATSQERIGSVFVLEDGRWKFWFSKTL
ncbi:MAG: hypothetical protein ACRDHE_01210 [Ktedonobacterales bacterium]